MDSSGIKGFNYYLNDVLQNETPLADESYRFPGLQQGTQYKIGVSAVDRAGNESDIRVQYISTEEGFPYSDPPMDPVDISAIDNIVNTYLATKKQNQTGVVVGITGPRGHLVKSYGSQMEVSNHFRIGSVSKTFVSTLIFMMIDQGKLSLDDTIDKYISGFPNGSIITIRNIMMMRAGWKDDQANQSMTMQLALNPTGTWDPHNNVNFMKSNPVQYAPDASYQYVDGNYIVLGYVLEAVTGRSIGDLLTNEIFNPLGMGETSFPAVNNPNIPSPHGDGFWHNPLTAIPIIGWFFTNRITSLAPGMSWCAGNIISTVNDLLIWANELRDGTLLSPESHTLRRDYFPHEYPNSAGSPNQPPKYKYGLGNIQEGSWRGHDGSWPGWDGICFYETVTGAAIVIYENDQTAGLTSMTWLFPDIAEYLYPTSISNENYNGPPRIGAKISEVATALDGSVGIPPLSLKKAIAALEGTTIQPGMAGVLYKPNVALVGTSKLSVEFESAGSGNQTSTQGQNTLAWGHDTEGGSDHLMVSFVTVDFQNGTLSVTCRIGDTEFPLAWGGPTYYIASNNTLHVWMATFAIFNPPAGLSTVEIDCTGTSTVNDIVANSFTYKNVGAVSNTLYQANGNSSAPTLGGIPLNLGDVAVGAFAGIAHVFTGFNKRQRWIQNNTASVPMVIGDTAGPGTISLGATLGASEQWGAEVLILSPVGA